MARFIFHTGRYLARCLGYDDGFVRSLPDRAVELFAGVANPFALRTLTKGERVVDVGSGAGFDLFVAAHQVGPNGKVVGIDMTEEMLAKSRASAEVMKLGHVEFREGLAEELPVADNWADVVISNGVINLCTDLDFGQNLNGLAIVRGAKHGVHQFLYGHGQAETVEKNPRLSCFSPKAPLLAVTKIAQIRLIRGRCFPKFSGFCVRVGISNLPTSRMGNRCPKRPSRISIFGRLQIAGGLPCAAWKNMLESVGFVGVEVGAPIDTFKGASGEKNARRFEVYGFPFLARKPG